MSQTTPQAAAAIDPASIERRAALASGAELLVRRRPPSMVSLADGHREHLLMTTTGRALAGQPVESVLRTERGERRWKSCPAGHVTFVPAGTAMEWSWSYESQSVHLTMPTSFIHHVGQQLEAGEQSLRPAFRVLDPVLTTLLHRLKAEAEDVALGKDLATSSLLTLIGVHVHRLGSHESVDDRSADGDGGLTHNERRQCIDILHDRLDEKVPIADLAARFGRSPYHFIRLFKQATGMPPHEYQIQLRVARAQSLLKTTKKTVADIACELGFSDESHLRRHFRRIVGTTPGRFRIQQ